MSPAAVLLTDAKIPFSCGAMQVETSSPLKSKIWVCVHISTSHWCLAALTLTIIYQLIATAWGQVDFAASFDAWCWFTLILQAYLPCLGEAIKQILSQFKLEIPISVPVLSVHMALVS